MNANNNWLGKLERRLAGSCSAGAFRWIAAFLHSIATRDLINLKSNSEHALSLTLKLRMSLYNSVSHLLIV